MTFQERWVTGSALLILCNTEPDSVEATKGLESSIHLCNESPRCAIIESDNRGVADVIRRAICKLAQLSFRH